jgi:hypothetical protein
VESTHHTLTLSLLYSPSVINRSISKSEEKKEERRREDKRMVRVFFPDMYMRLMGGKYTTTLLHSTLLHSTPHYSTPYRRIVLCVEWCGEW